MKEPTGLDNFLTRNDETKELQGSYKPIEPPSSP